MKNKSDDTSTSRSTCETMGRTLRCESGQSLIELALLTPLLLALILGVVEMGRYTYLSILLGNAAEAGAAYGAEKFGQRGLLKQAWSAAAQADFQNSTSASTILRGLTVPILPTLAHVIAGERPLPKFVRLALLLALVQLVILWSPSTLQQLERLLHCSAGLAYLALLR